MYHYRTSATIFSEWKQGLRWFPAGWWQTPVEKWVTVSVWDRKYRWGVRDESIANRCISLCCRGPHLDKSEQK